MRFAHLAAGLTFTTAELYPEVLETLGCSASSYSLASLRYDLSKLRAERIYAPLTAGLLRPLASDRKLQEQRRSQIDRLYQRVVDDLHKLMQAVGLKTAA